MAYVGNWSQTLVIDVLVSFNFALVFNSVFPFPLTKAQFILYVPMKRQNAAKCSPPLLIFLCVTKEDRDSEEDRDAREIKKSIIKDRYACCANMTQ